ncbi:MAG: LamG-like jellyroll fold domain-containing protein [Planctomycetota bacterium]
MYSGNAPLTLGRINFTGNEYYYDGLVDEVRVSSVARYTATNAVADGSSFRNDGAHISVASVAGGKYGKAYEFDGASSYVEAPDDNSLDMTGDLTIEAWVKADTVSGYRNVVAKWLPSGDQRSWQMWIEEGKLRGRVSPDGAYGSVVSVTSQTSISAGTWTHVAFVRCDDELSLWINGTKDANTATFTGTVYSGSAPLTIGRINMTDNWYYFDGQIDEVRASNFARSAFSDATLTYDDNGNLTSDGDMEYQYDVFNRLLKVTKSADDSVVAEYLYDGLGRRVLKSVGNDDTRYVYDGNDVVCEYNANDALVCRYVMGRSIDEPMRMERLIEGNWRNFYYQTNALGSIVALNEWDSGEQEETIVERYTYDAYGRLLVHTPGTDGTFGTSDDNYRATSSVGNPYGFTARALDTETGLMYYRVRYYSPLLGRFISSDPLGHDAGINLYGGYFVPNGVDPMGLDNVQWPSNFYVVSTGESLVYHTAIQWETGGADRKETGSTMVEYGPEGVTCGTADPQRKVVRQMSRKAEGRMTVNGAEIDCVCATEQDIMNCLKEFAWDTGVAAKKNQFAPSADNFRAWGKKPPAGAKLYYFSKSLAAQLIYGHTCREFVEEAPPQCCLE